MEIKKGCVIIRWHFVYNIRKSTIRNGVTIIMKLKAFGKINLGLDVVRRRENGYHDVRMIMQTVGIFDRLDFQKVKEPGIQISTNLSFLPSDKNNLVYQAAKLLMDEFKIKEGISIDLEKHIPVAAGMAGGSSDCAATLVGVNYMFNLGLSMEELMERGVKLGADVPYCVMRGTALSEGIGEVLTPLPAMPDCFILIAKPPISVSTKFVYENLQVGKLQHHPDIDGMVTAIHEGNLKGITDRMENVLETVTAAKYPVIEEIKEFMRNHGAMESIMSGSGPTVFGIYNDKESIEKASRALKDSGLAKQVFITYPANKKVGEEEDES